MLPGMRSCWNHLAGPEIDHSATQPIVNAIPGTGRCLERPRTWIHKLASPPHPPSTTCLNRCPSFQHHRHLASVSGFVGIYQTSCRLNCPYRTQPATK
ncbi:hypothetical protein Mapa_003010 [Marchantia paleacea]|nr:hypothetical protein Mapa_003010 [Marchantia paleacea]